ncbi:MAG: transporter substrate-binding domain-containing protein [Bermanella sp.]
MNKLSASSYFIKLLICLVVFVFSWQIASQPLPKELNLVTGDDFKPWTDRSLENGGVITEIVQAVFKNINVETQVGWLPWKRGYQRVVSGSNNTFATFPYSYSNTRTSDVYYSIPLLISGLTIFVLEDNPTPKDYKDQSDLEGLRFCTGLGYAFDDFVALLEAKKVTLLTLSNVENCFLNIKAGRADAVVLNKHVGWGMIHSLYEKDHGFRALKEHKPSVYHLVVNKSYPNTLDILNEFNKSLVQLQKSGGVDEIINRHMKPVK